MQIITYILLFLTPFLLGPILLGFPSDGFEAELAIENWVAFFALIIVWRLFCPYIGRPSKISFEVPGRLERTLGKLHWPIFILLLLLVLFFINFFRTKATPQVFGLGLGIMAVAVLDDTLFRRKNSLFSIASFFVYNSLIGLLSVRILQNHWYLPVVICSVSLGLNLTIPRIAGFIQAAVEEREQLPKKRSTDRKLELMQRATRLIRLYSAVIMLAPLGFTVLGMQGLLPRVYALMIICPAVATPLLGQLHRWEQHLAPFPGDFDKQSSGISLLFVVMLLAVSLLS